MCTCVYDCSRRVTEMLRFCTVICTFVKMRGSYEAEAHDERTNSLIVGGVYERAHDVTSFENPGEISGRDKPTTPSLMHFGFLESTRLCPTRTVSVSAVTATQKKKKKTEERVARRRSGNIDATLRLKLHPQSVRWCVYILLYE